MSSHSGIAPEWLTKEYLEKMLAYYYAGSSLHLEDFSVSPGSKVGENYICEIFRIELNYIRDNQKETRFIIGKVLAKTSLTDELTKNADVFGSEVKALQKTLPLLFEELKNTIGTTDRFFPEVLFVDEPNQSFFMEDLKQMGYQLADRKKSLDLSHSLLVMKALASMHASSYLLFQKDPDHKKMYLNYFWENVNDAVANIIEGSHQSLLKALPSWPLDDEIKQKLKNLNGVEISHNSYKRKEDSFNALLHGDCWMTNMMFKYDNGNVSSVKLLDYQIVNYSSIGLDLNYFIFTSSAPYVKLEHLNDLLSTYYDTFVSITGEIEGFSLETVRKEFHDKLGVGLTCQIFSRPAVMGASGLDIGAQMKKEDSSDNDNLFLFEPYIDETIKILPLFLEHGAL